jgi:hypothetical protein
LYLSPVDSLVMGDAGSAISVIRDGNMETIGELGFIYDPAVSGTGNHSSGTRNRGGFRTLAVGSRVGELRRIRSLTGSGEIELNGPATLVPDSEDSEDYQDRHINDSNRADRLLELFSVSDDRSGKILLNSALRDPRNLPLRALMHELQTQTNLTADADYPAPADPYLVNSALTVDDDALIEQMMEASAIPTSVPSWGWDIWPIFPPSIPAPPCWVAVARLFLPAVTIRRSMTAGVKRYSATSWSA